MDMNGFAAPLSAKKDQQKQRSDANCIPKPDQHGEDSKNAVKDIKGTEMEIQHVVVTDVAGYGKVTKGVGQEQKEGINGKNDKVVIAEQRHYGTSMVQIADDARLKDAECLAISAEGLLQVDVNLAGVKMGRLNEGGKQVEGGQNISDMRQIEGKSHSAEVIADHGRRITEFDNGLNVYDRVKTEMMKLGIQEKGRLRKEALSSKASGQNTSNLDDSQVFSSDRTQGMVLQDCNVAVKAEFVQQQQDKKEGMQAGVHIKGQSDEKRRLSWADEVVAVDHDSNWLQAMEEEGRMLLKENPDKMLTRDNRGAAVKLVKGTHEQVKVDFGTSFLQQVEDFEKGMNDDISTPNVRDTTVIIPQDVRNKCNDETEESNLAGKIEEAGFHSPTLKKISNMNFHTELPIDFDPLMYSQEKDMEMYWSQLIGNKVQLVTRRSVSLVGRSSKKLKKLRKRIEYLEHDATKSLMLDMDDYLETQKVNLQLENKDTPSLQISKEHVSTGPPQDEQQWSTPKRRGRHR